jgi:hypothetical protein
MRVITAVEIFTNPTDLYFSIAKGKTGGHLLAISRGPGHNFKLLLTRDEPGFESKELAIGAVRDILTNVRKHILKILKEDPDDLLSGFINPDGLSVDEMSAHTDALTLERIDQVVSDLEIGGVAVTYEEVVTMEAVHT